MSAAPGRWLSLGSMAGCRDDRQLRGKSGLGKVPKHGVVDDRTFELHAEADELLGERAHLGQRAHGLGIFQCVPYALGGHPKPTISRHLKTDN